MNLLLKTMWGETKGLMLLFWNALFVSEREVWWEGGKGARLVWWQGGKGGRVVRWKEGKGKRG